LRPLLLLICLYGILSTTPAKGQSISMSPEVSFLPGESITYMVYYHYKNLWVSAGEVTFQIDTSRIFNRNTYHFIGTGFTYKKWDWFYKMRNRFEVHVDKKTFQPYRYIRDSQQGGSYIHNEYIFHPKKDEVYLVHPPKRKKDGPTTDTLQVPGNTKDIMSLIYYSRCMNFEGSNAGDTLPFSLLIDNEVHESYIRYLGKEIYEHEDLGKILCYKFSPLLVKGSIFQGGEGMIVWATADENRIPVYVESEILVGSVKAHLIRYKGTRYPFMKGK